MQRFLLRDPNCCVIRKTVADLSSMAFLMVRAGVNTCAAFGAKIVARVLSDPVSRQRWKDTLASMASKVRWGERECLHCVYSM